MQGCVVAIVFCIGSVLLLGGLLSYGGHLFGASDATIGIGAGAEARKRLACCTHFFVVTMRKLVPISWRDVTSDERFP